MKAVSVVCGESSVSSVSSGKVSKSRKDIENEEIQMYLSKLKDLVPFMPKNRKLSKLEVIQYVIDYICDLQSALETHPAVNSFDAAAVLSQKKSQGAVSPRQPLGVRASPNTILAPSEAPILQNVTVSIARSKWSKSQKNPIKISTHLKNRCVFVFIVHCLQSVIDSFKICAEPKLRRLLWDIVFAEEDDHLTFALTCGPRFFLPYGAVPKGNGRWFLLWISQKGIVHTHLKDVGKHFK